MAKMPRRGKFSLDTNENPTKQENDFANKMGGKRVVRSGAHRSSGHYDGGSGYKGDVSLDEFEFECKQTSKKSMSIKADWLNRMALGAYPKGKKPGLHIQFNGLDVLCDSKWVLIEERVFEELVCGVKAEEEK